MPRELTAADMAEYSVTFTRGAGDTESRSVMAAYIAADDAKMPGMLVFKDWQHRTVAVFNAGAVLVAERLERGEHAPPEGFKPTSQVITEADVRRAGRSHA
jgi:hypothetical protein